MYGIQLKGQKGNCDGKYNDVNYFKCRSKYGIYCKESELMLRSKKIKMDKKKQRKQMEQNGQIDFLNEIKKQKHKNINQNMDEYKHKDRDQKLLELYDISHLRFRDQTQRLLIENYEDKVMSLGNVLNADGLCSKDDLKTYFNDEIGPSLCDVCSLYYICPYLRVLIHIIENI